ncbi:MAG: HupE/UreJ family protein [Gammaproteobacteria bacterium]|nr:HupE/UreJ family protein [Gammaproteobacteria bacterium]
MSGKHYALVCLLVLLVPATALAHSPIQGIGNFYNGLLHPVLVPAHLLLLLAVGLFLGQQGPKRVELALGAFAAATVVGLVVAWFANDLGLETLVLALSATVGLLVAMSPHIALTWCVIIALLAGLMLGIDSAQAELSGQDKLASLFGSGVAIYFLALYPLAMADYFNQKAWQKIGIRIVGSWVAASSLLVLALSLAPKP